MAPLLTLKVHDQLHAARAAGEPKLACSLDLGRSVTEIGLSGDHWTWNGASFPYLEKCKERTIYYWAGASFEPVSRFTSSLIKLVPTDWGPPTFEIDGIKMLPTERISPYADAERKVALVAPRDKESGRALATRAQSVVAAG
jgi:predicted methyltransferase